MSNKTSMLTLKYKLISFAIDESKIEGPQGIPASDKGQSTQLLSDFCIFCK